jgi:hypothetical protein
VVDDVLGQLRLGVRNLELRPVRDLGLGEDGNGRRKPPALVVRLRQLVVDLRLLGGADAGACDGIPVPSCDVALDRLVVEAFLADPGHEDGHRHLPLAEAGNLHALGQVGGRVLDGVMDVRLGDVDRQPDLVVRQLFDLGAHAAIRPKDE